MVVSCRTQGRRTGYGRYGARRTNNFLIRGKLVPVKKKQVKKMSHEKNNSREISVPVKYKKEDRRTSCGQHRRRVSVQRSTVTTVSRETRLLVVANQGSSV